MKNTGGFHVKDIEQISVQNGNQYIREIIAGLLCTEPDREKHIRKTREEDLSSHWSCCDTCGFCYSERQSESHVEYENTGAPYTPPQEEKDEVMLMQDMVERLLHGSLESNRRARV